MEDYSCICDILIDRLDNLATKADEILLLLSEIISDLRGEDDE